MFHVLYLVRLKGMTWCLLPLIEVWILHVYISKHPSAFVDWSAQSTHFLVLGPHNSNPECADCRTVYIFRYMNRKGLSIPLSIVCSYLPILRNETIPSHERLRFALKKQDHKVIVFHTVSIRIFQNTNSPIVVSSSYQAQVSLSPLYQCDKGSIT